MRPDTVHPEIRQRQKRNGDVGCAFCGEVINNPDDEMTYENEPIHRSCLEIRRRHDHDPDQLLLRAAEDDEEDPEFDDEDDEDDGDDDEDLAEVEDDGDEDLLDDDFDEEDDDDDFDDEDDA